MIRVRIDIEREDGVVLTGIPATASRPRTAPSESVDGSENRQAYETLQSFGVTRNDAMDQIAPGDKIVLAEDKFAVNKITQKGRSVLLDCVLRVG